MLLLCCCCVVGVVDVVVVVVGSMAYTVRCFRCVVVGCYGSVEDSSNTVSGSVNVNCEL